MNKNNNLKYKLATKKAVYGCVLNSKSPVVVEMLGYSGFDFVFIDTEHSPIGIDDNLENLVRAADASGISAVVRVKENNINFIRNALEVGAQGIVVPHVVTKADAELAVKYSFFPPLGIRGGSHSVRAAKYSCGEFNWEKYVEKSNNDVVVIPLLEDKEIIDNLEEICNTEGVGAVGFGATDYAMSIGLNSVYAFEDPRIMGALTTIVEYSKKNNLNVMSVVNPCTLEQSKKLADMGVNMQLIAGDIGLIKSSLVDIYKNIIEKMQ